MAARYSSNYFACRITLLLVFSAASASDSSGEIYDLDNGGRVLEKNGENELQTRDVKEIAEGVKLYPNGMIDFSGMIKRGKRLDSEEFQKTLAGLVSEITKGTNFNLDNKGVKARVYSPREEQMIEIEGGKAMVNGKVVCSDIGKLGSAMTYQRRPDGSLWHTNLNVGRKMTRKDIQDFNRFTGSTSGSTLESTWGSSWVPKLWSWW